MLDMDMLDMNIHVGHGHCGHGHGGHILPAQFGLVLIIMPMFSFFRHSQQMP